MELIWFGSQILDLFLDCNIRFCSLVCGIGVDSHNFQRVYSLSLMEVTESGFDGSISCCNLCFDLIDFPFCSIFSSASCSLVAVFR